MTHKKNKAEIISIGDELLIGQVVNSNASWMGEQLFLNGFTLQWVTTIGDNEEDIHNAIQIAVQRAQFVFLTGGLGPTADDLTKPALANFFHVDLKFNPDAFHQIEELFALRGFSVTERNRLQAMLPSNCKPIKNRNGTAAGMWFEHNGSIIVSMPGVPFEMKPMFSEQILPALKQTYPSLTYRFKTIMTSGAGESFLADIIQQWEESLPSHFKLAYLPQPGIVRLRLGGYGTEPAQVEKELEKLSVELKDLLELYVYGHDNQMLEEVVGNLLRQNELTIATAESCTGGYISHLITSVPGSSAYFKGGVVAYANEVKEDVLNVSASILKLHGAVSREVAESMAVGARELMKSDYALAVTGIAGPDGGTKEKPVGTTWISVAWEGGIYSQKFQLGEERGRNIRRAALAALNMLRLELIKKAER